MRNSCDGTYAEMGRDFKYRTKFNNFHLHEEIPKDFVKTQNNKYNGQRFEKRKFIYISNLKRMNCIRGRERRTKKNR